MLLLWLMLIEPGWLIRLLTALFLWSRLGNILAHLYFYFLITIRDTLKQQS